MRIECRIECSKKGKGFLQKQEALKLNGTPSGVRTPDTLIKS